MAQHSVMSGVPDKSVAQCAKAALRRLAVDKLEPTPENYALAYRLESGSPPTPTLPTDAMAVLQVLVARAIGFEDEGGRGRKMCSAMAAGQWERANALLMRHGDEGAQIAGLIDGVVRGIERGNRKWTSALRKESLHRVLEANRGDAARLQLRVGQLLRRWSEDLPAATRETDEAAVGHAVTGAVEAAEDAPIVPSSHAVPAGGGDVLPDLDGLSRCERLNQGLVEALRKALPPSDAQAQQIAGALADAARRALADGACTAQVDEMLELAGSSMRVFEHRHHLVDMLGGLCHEMAASLGELAEDESWAKGQCEAMRVALEDGLSARSVKSVTELLRKTRAHQAQMRSERERARTVLKAMFNQMLGELGELGIQTGRFHDSVGRYAEVIEGAESLESLTGVVRDIVEESRAVQALVIQAQQKLNAEHAKATDLSQRVNQLEDELRRLSNEVSTDQLTQVANRRGLLDIFERDCRRMRRSGGSLSIGLLDIDNFKRLNDELGHNVGDTALKSLAAAVSDGLRPEDTVARYGGEEFVVLLPDTDVEDAGDVLTRLQRSLSGGLFMHEHRNVMVTFSAGVTAYREGERIEECLERADRALFEAKRAGKNRTRSA